MLGLEVYDIKNNKHPDLPIFTLYAQILSFEIRYSASNLQEEHIKNPAIKDEPNRNYNTRPNQSKQSPEALT